jgi:subtilase family serine protease
LDSPNSELSVPSGIAPDILAVTGLDDGAALMRPDHVTSDTGTAVGNAAQADRNTVNAPCSKYYGQHVVAMPEAYGVKKFPTNICGYTAVQLEEGYGIGSAISTGNDGSGVTVAITDAYASSTIESDANAFSSLEGIPTLKSGQLTQDLAKTFDLQTECGGTAGWNLEETLDVEAVHTTAPGANIVYVGAKNCANGLGIVAVNDVVAHHLADIVTDSWSEGTENLPPSALNAEHAIWVQGASEGIGFNFSSGDDGDLLAVTGETQPSVPASDPEVTAVGGTSLAVGQGGNYESETGWGNDRAPVAYNNSGAPVGYGLPLPGEFYAGAGGGTSHVFAEPSYQDGVVPSSLADEYGTPSRVVPDVSALADPYTGMEEVETMNGTLTAFAIGGTSLSSPLFAGMEALADQSRNAAIGFANPLLYSISGTDAFHDVTPTVSPVALAFTSSNPASLCYDSCLITQGHDTSLQTTAGYDNVTGIGSPNGMDFIKGLAQAS